MSIQPIDVQNLLMRLDQIGKDQAASRDAAVHKQAVTGSQIAQHSEAMERQVNETAILDDGGATGVHEDDGHGQQSGDNDHANENASEQQQEVVSDPNLGQNIDIVG